MRFYMRAACLEAIHALLHAGLHVQRRFMSFYMRCGMSRGNSCGLTSKHMLKKALCMSTGIFACKHMLKNSPVHVSRKVYVQAHAEKRRCACQQKILRASTC